MLKRVIYSVTITIFILSIAFVIISYGRGYRINLEKKAINPTGILSASSSPDGASIWIDDELTSATNASISLSPGWHSVRISKEGYISWEKNIKILREVVNIADALLIPTNPSLRAITASGVLKPSLSPTGTKIAYIVPLKEASESASIESRSGVWILDLRPGPLGRKSEPKQVYKLSSERDIENANLFWSPDEKTLIISFIQSEENARKEKKEILYKSLQIPLTNSDSIPIEVSNRASFIFNEWEKEKSKELKDLIETRVKAPIADLLLNSTNNIRFSSDENKILYEATASAQLPQVIIPPLIGSNPTEETRTLKKGGIYIYDSKEDKNFLLYNPDSQDIPEYLTWHFDSKHVFAIEKESIVIVDYDGTNKRTVYAGPFDNKVLMPSPLSSQLLILTNLNNPLNLPNLYELDLR